ncbi:MAG: hypothetical protein ABUT20_28170, partial [Bacteroidota bacterium]
AAPEINIVKSTEGVLHFLYWLCDYAIISKSDVEAIRVFLDVYYDVWLEKANINAVHNPLIEGYENFDIDSYKENNQVEKIFLPTLGYFLLAKPETVKEFLHHAI